MKVVPTNTHTHTHTPVHTHTKTCLHIYNYKVTSRKTKGQYKLYQTGQPIPLSQTLSVQS